MSEKVVNAALLGLGTVGTGVYKVIKNHKFKAGIFFLFAWYFFNNTAIFRSLFPNFIFYFNLTKSAEKQF